MKLLEEVEHDVSKRAPPPRQEWADALLVCKNGGLADRRVRSFLEKSLVKIVAACVEQAQNTPLLETTLKLASAHIGAALEADFSPWAAKSLVSLLPPRGDSLPVVFRHPDDASQANELLLRCAEIIAVRVKGMLQRLNFRELLFTWCREEDRFDELEAVLRTCNLNETRHLDTPGSTLKEMAERLLDHLRALEFQSVPAELTEAGKQMNTDGLEGVDRILQWAGGDAADTIRLKWKQLAVECIQLSEKLMLRRAGLDIFAKLAEFAPQKTSEWLVAKDSAGDSAMAGESVLDCLTGERAHEKLVDALRNCVYALARHRPQPDDDEGHRGSDLTTHIIDSMVATCVGSDQHPTKDVRDAFRAALAKLTVTLPHVHHDRRVGKGSRQGRLRVAYYLVTKLLQELRSEKEGAAELSLLIFTVPAHATYDQISSCQISPRHLVSACTETESKLEMQLSRATFDLLFESFVQPSLAANYTLLLQALAVCFHHGACTGRPGTENQLKDDILHFVTFCTGRLQGDRMAVDASPAQVRSCRTIVVRLLMDVLFFHLRNDSVAQQEKWKRDEGSLDHPRNMDWAKEGRVPMLNMTRGAYLEACERDHKLSSLLVADALKLQEEAICEGRASSSEHEEELWLRLQVLRFLHVEQDNNQSQKVSFQVMERLWQKLPSELCCKWFRVLADSGDALSEEVTERAFKELVCGVDLPKLGKHGFNCFEALFGEINSRHTQSYASGRMQIKGRQVVHKGIKISGQNLVKRRVSWFCVNALRRNVGTITGFDDSLVREKEPFDFENDDLFDGRSKINQLVPLKELFDCHVVEDARSPQDLRAFEIQQVYQDESRQFACDLIGMDELWRVALEAHDEGVAARASELMLALSRKLPAKFMIDFLSRIFDELETSYPLSKPPPMSPYRGAVLRAPGASGDAGNGSDASAHVMQIDAGTSPAVPARAGATTRPAPPGNCSGVEAPRQGLRFSRALGLMQCLLNVHMVQCGHHTLLPHRCCVRGAALRDVTLKFNQRKGRKAVGLLNSPLQNNVLSDQHHLNLQSPHRRPAGNVASTAMTHLGKSGAFAAVTQGQQPSEPIKLDALHGNVTVSRVLEMAKTLLPVLNDAVPQSLELKVGDSPEAVVMMREPGKTLQEIGCLDCARITISYKVDAAEPLGQGVLPPQALTDLKETPSILHLMSDESNGECAGDKVTGRFTHLLASLEQLEARELDDGLGEQERAHLQQQLWLLLASLPTAGYIKKRVADALNGSVQWEQILSKDHGIWRSAYVLQVVESMLQASDKYLHPAETQNPLKQVSEEPWRDRMRRKFVSQGGAERVLKLAAEVCGGDGAWCHPERISWQICTPVFLRVLRLILLHLPSLTAPMSGEDPMELDSGGLTCSNLRADGVHAPASLMHVNKLKDGVKAGSPATLAGTGRRVAIVGGPTTASRENGHEKQDYHGEQAGAALNGLAGSSAAKSHQHTPDLRDSLAKIVRILLESLIMLSARSPQASTRRSAAMPAQSDTSAGGSRSSSLGRSAVVGAQVANIIPSMLQLILMIMKDVRSCLTVRHRSDIVNCIFQPVHADNEGVRGKPREVREMPAMPAQDPRAKTSNVEAVIRQLLIAGSDQTVREQTSEMLFQAILLGWDLQVARPPAWLLFCCLSFRLVQIFLCCFCSRAQSVFVCAAAHSILSSICLRAEEAAGQECVYSNGRSFSAAGSVLLEVAGHFADRRGRGTCTSWGRCGGGGRHRQNGDRRVLSKSERSRSLRLDAAHHPAPAGPFD